MRDDLTRLTRAVATRTTRAADAVEASIDAGAAEPSRHAFLSTRFEAARLAARAVDVHLASQGACPRLAGAAVSVKDLFDVVGEVTAAGSIVMASGGAASTDAPAVARLREHGAALVGRTNMSEFAFSGVGINPHHGTPLNASTMRLDGLARIPGGSTSGGAVSVASGAAWAALGSDTGGSIRVPAALHGLVGFKNTARLTPTEGALPLSTTLDTVCAITRSVRDAVLLHEVLAARTVRLRRPALSQFRFAVPSTLLLDALDPLVARAFERAVRRLRAAGASVVDIALPEIDEAAAINAGGGFAAAESWALHRRMLTDREAEIDPRVAVRIRRGASMSAADYIDLLQARRGWIARMHLGMLGFDAMLSPTVPMPAPLLAPLIESDAAFFAANAALLRNPAIVNFLDGCALTLPCQDADELPVGLMVWAGALCDDVVLDASLAIEAVLDPVPA